MESFDWKYVLHSWCDEISLKKKNIKDLEIFFTNAFDFNSMPHESLYGSAKNAISVVVGNIYLAAFTRKQGIWLLIDREINNIPDTDVFLTAASKKFEKPLFWFSCDNLRKFEEINNDKDLWESYQRATLKIFENKSITARKANVAKGKNEISNFWNNANSSEKLRTKRDIDKELEEKIKYYKNLPEKDRLNLSREYNKKPEKILITQTAFNRNPFVIIKVLDRAKGICEKCKKKAPFIRDADRTPYLEVHHIIPLSEDGDDTVENAIALCANCHRHAHFGKSTY